MYCTDYLRGEKWKGKANTAALQREHPFGNKRQNGLDEAQKKKRRKKGSVYVNIQNSTITTASHNVVNPNAMDRIRAAVATVQGIANIDLEQLLNAISGNINEVWVITIMILF